MPFVGILITGIPICSLAPGNASIYANPFLK
jgi:hypothetical protein